MRRENLRDRLGLTPKQPPAGLAPERHLATVQIPEAAKFEGRHGAQATRVTESGRGALLMGLGLVGLGVRWRIGKISGVFRTTDARCSDN